MEHREFKDRLYAEFARIAKAIANPHRIELIDLLAQGERSVADLAGQASMTIANTSQHLQVLMNARLVETTRDGTYVFYRLADQRVFSLWQSMRDLGEAQLPEVDRVVQMYLHERDGLEAVDIRTLVDRLKAGDITLLDVRPAEEYRAGHLPGARSIPINELKARLDELPNDANVIAYCRGPYCVYADEAVSLLNASGFHASRFELGFPDWQVAGLPVERGATAS